MQDDEPLRFSVRNDSADDVGIYLRPVGEGDVGVDEGSAVQITGHRNQNPEYQNPGWAVSGCVEGVR
jgi:hypothetical protein